MNVKEVTAVSDTAYKLGYEEGYAVGVIVGEKAAKERALQEFEKILIKIKAGAS